jgi:Acyl-CoA thioesterase C-terminal domain
VPDAFYEPDGELLVPSGLTRGPWDPGAQHAGPPSALVARAIERHEPRERLRVGRITLEILQPVPLAPLSVSVKLVRPGRSVELLEASLSGPDGELIRARAWRVQASDLRLDEHEPPPPGPDAGAEGEFFATGQEVGYHTAMDFRFVEGAFTEIGPAVVWLRMRVPLVAGEPTSPLARVLVAADAGNGVSATLDYRRFVFINTELTVHMLREPDGEWVCLDAVTRLGAPGLGLAESVLSDERGRIGRGAQTLLVRPR